LLAVIDDDDSFRTALIELLGSMAYRARGFASAEEFVAAGEIGSYDCIITDVHMPGMSGLGLKQLLDRMECRAPVIIVTARAEQGLESKVLSSGAFCLLIKPFEAEILLDRVEKALIPGC
jgi:FixJ family two-component response regulator